MLCQGSAGSWGDARRGGGSRRKGENRELRVRTHAAPARRPRREIQPSEGSGCPAAGAGTRRASLGVSRAPPGARSSGAVTIFGSAAGAGSGGGGFSSFSSSSRNVSQPSPGQGCSAQTPGSEGGSQPLPGAAGHTKAPVPSAAPRQRTPFWSESCPDGKSRQRNPLWEQPVPTPGIPSSIHVVFPLATPSTEQPGPGAPQDSP